MSSAVRRPDTEGILGGLKDFQRRTVDYVFERMYGADDPTMRFLVADEVGLGKTLVARGVVAKTVDALWDDVPRIDVVYICSNGDIARQNVRRLNILDDDGFALASRIMLLPSEIKDLKHRKVNFVSFTPGTSLRTHSAMGIARERALLYWMLRGEWELGRRAGPLNVLQGGAGRDSFRSRVRSFDRHGIDPTLTRAFHSRLIEHDRRERHGGRDGLRERFDELCERFARSRDALPEHDREDRRELIADLRAVLAASCVTALEPDLVILDEFQRFRELLEPDRSDDAAKLANELFTYSDAHSKVRVLLLSATPYKMFTRSGEEAEGDHYQDFVRTLGFLFDDPEQTREVETLLDSFRRTMLRIEEDGALSSLRAAKDEIEKRLRRVIVRTERLAVSEDRDGMLVPMAGDGVRLAANDVRSYVGLQRISDQLDRPDLVEYWKSAPYPFNFMDEYAEKRALRAALGEPDRETALREPVKAGAAHALLPWARVERFGAVHAVNPRLRRLRGDLIDSGGWRQLWISPSLPYHALERPFDEGSEGLATKRLVFSSWAMVPKATAALLTYGAEREMHRSHRRRPTNTPEARERRARPLTYRRRGGRLASLPVLGLMYGSPTLARELDPLAIALELDVPLASLNDVLRLARLRARKLVREITADAPRTGKPDETWYGVAAMLIDLRYSPRATLGWLRSSNVVPEASPNGRSGGGDAAATEHVDLARQILSNVDAGTMPLGPAPADLERVVALQGIAGPGTAALRALGRITGFHHLEDDLLRDGAGRIASGLRTLFNVPEAVAVVRGLDRREPYWQRVLEYSTRGCLQAVLDEYVHVMVEAQGLVDRDPEKVGRDVPDAIERALTLRPAQLAVDEIGVVDGRVRMERHQMRARFASRFGVDERSDDGSEVTPTDAVRNAFNSPFWPFALISTSIGQEGLDFHLYCHAVVHWNLPSNPVDLEQREGRVHRFKGHAVRKNLARRYGLTPLTDSTTDPWELLFERARDDRGTGQTDLVPYWIYPVKDGARIERHVPALPMSRDLDRYEQLRRSLVLYRMAFGQARQDDLVDFLTRQLSPDRAREVAEELRIDLSPSERPD